MWYSVSVFSRYFRFSTACSFACCSFRTASMRSISSSPFVSSPRATTFCRSFMSSIFLASFIARANRRPLCAPGMVQSSKGSSPDADLALACTTASW